MSDKKHSDAFEPLRPEELKQWLVENGVALTEKVAVAVSGGADSMCLALLTSEIADTAALIVDHRLRDESTREAEAVQQRLKLCGIDAEILTWRMDEKPSSNVQAEARQARYQLMADWCRSNNVRYLLVAHHQDDQAETVVLRLARGSGLSGLSGMAPIRELAPGVTLVRPLLDIPKSRLVETMRHQNVDWVEDPSNQNEDFDRIKVRKLLENPPVPGFTAVRMADTTAHLRRAKDAIDYYVAEWMDDAVTFHDAGFAQLCVGRFSDVPEEVSLRGLANILQFASGAPYSPRFEKLHRLWQMVQDPAFAGSTLNGAQLTGNRDGVMTVFREMSAVNFAVSVEKHHVWDGRYEVNTNAPVDTHELSLGALGPELVASVRENTGNDLGVSAAILSVLPAFFRSGRLIAVPHLGYDVANQKLPILTHLWLASSENGKKTYRGVQ